MLYYLALTVFGLSVVYGADPMTCPSGKPIYARGLSEADKATVVDAHNKYRLDIANGRVSGQPKGIDLKRMVWDEDLHEGAKVVSNTCQMKHLIKNDSRFPVGQNIFKSFDMFNNSKPEWNRAVESWFEEHVDFSYPNKSTGVTGHYTQVVWASSQFLGCDYAYYYDETTKPDCPFTKLYTCNYGPAGNYYGEAPYKTGTSGCENLC